MNYSRKKKQKQNKKLKVIAMLKKISLKFCLESCNGCYRS